MTKSKPKGHQSQHLIKKWIKHSNSKPLLIQKHKKLHKKYTDAKPKYSLFELQPGAMSILSFEIWE